MGQVGSYIHAGGKIGVLVEINCETDFVGKTEEYSEFVKNVAMHIAAAAPIAVKKEEIDPEVVEKEKTIYPREGPWPRASRRKFWTGSWRANSKSSFPRACLLEQPYVKDPDMTIADYLNQTIRQDRRIHGDPPLLPLRLGRRAGLRAG